MSKSILPPPNEAFFQIWHKFTANIGSLWLYSQQIPEMADRLDQEKVREIALEMADIFDDDPKEAEKEFLAFLPSLDELDVYPNFYENANVRETFDLFKTSDFKERVLEWALENIGKAQRLVHIVTTYLAEPPANGVILRRSALVTLLSFLEILFEDLFFVYFHYVNPNGTSTEEKARKKAKGIQGWKKRIEKVKSFGVQLHGVEDYLDEFYEIAERRNRIVHGDGVITKEYIEKIPVEYQSDGSGEGRILIVSTRYLFRAFHLITLIAFQTCQIAWREWRPNKSSKKANEALERFVFSTLIQRRYDLVKDLASVSGGVILSRRYKQFVIVNHAIALRELGETKEMQTTISLLRSEKREWRVNIAYVILQGNHDKARLLLLQAAARNELINVSEYWPLFDPVRSEQWFINVFDTANRGKLPG
jgi:hypothetical protein